MPSFDALGIAERIIRSPYVGTPCVDVKASDVAVQVEKASSAGAVTPSGAPVAAVLAIGGQAFLAADAVPPAIQVLACPAYG